MYLPQGISQYNQSRADARRARWDPVSDRSNFYIATGQYVRRVLFEGGCASANKTSVRAIGVEVSAGRNGKVWTAAASREVILAAGALRTPGLLELSGIGADHILAEAGIKSRISLPGVGENLQDHMLMHMSQGFNNESYVYPNIMQNKTINDWARSLYYKNRTGPFTFGPPDGNAFLSLPQISTRAQEIAQIASAYSTADYLADGLDETIIRGYARQRELLIPALEDNSRAVIEFLQDNGGNTQISNQRPLTRGSVHINGSNPADYPILDFRYGSNPTDMAVMMESLRFNDKLFQQPEIQILQPVQNDPPHDATDAQLMEFLNRALGTEYHPSGTAAMMPREHGGVVDSKLLVYGTDNLRVVDSSLFPLIPSAHLEAVVYGVAEKAADLIKRANTNIKIPHLPLNQAQCLIAPIISLKTKRADNIASYGVSNDLIGLVGGYPAVGYPNYNPSSTKGFDLSADDRPASVGLPRGGALEWADAVIQGILTDVILGPIGDLLGDVVGQLMNETGGILSEYTRDTTDSVATEDEKDGRHFVA
jgi:choline dehydrogenase